MAFAGVHAFPEALFFSYSGGWSSYRAEELNAVMRALENQAAQSGGLNHYRVDRFDGHPRQALVVGLEWKRWFLGVEGEFWVENFAQSEVPFYLNRDLDARFVGRDISCAELREPGFNPVEQGVAGCLSAREVFTIIPLTIQLAYRFAEWRGLGLSAGLAAGVLAGDAFLDVATDFIGENARPDDRVKITLYPGVNPVFKGFVDAEWRLFSWLGLGLRGGWRLSRMRYVEVHKKRGESFLLGLILGDDSRLQQGDRAWLIEQQDRRNILVIRGAPDAVEIRQAELAGQRWNLVQGDFSGWIAEMKINLMWRWSD